MFSPLEAMAYKGQLPEQNGQNAVNPQLKNLFAIQAAMDAKKHADEQLAAALGQQTQNQPTVAAGLQQAAQQALRPEQASPREVASQNMGLPGIVQGQQAPQARPPQATMGQPPQAQAPQQMAAGGLAGAKSNLPSRYAGGGIVSFDEGGTTGTGSGQDDRLASLMQDKARFERMGADTSSIDAAIAARQSQIMRPVMRNDPRMIRNAEETDTGVTTPMGDVAMGSPAAAPSANVPAGAPSATAAGMAGYTPPKRYVDTNAAPSAAPVSGTDEVTAGRLEILNKELQQAQANLSNPSATPEAKERAQGDVSALSREIAYVSKTAGYKSPATTGSSGGLGATAPAQAAAQATQAGQGISAATQPPLRAATEKSLMDVFNRSQADERAAEEQKFAAGPGAAQQADVAAQKEGIAKLAALQAAKAAGRPSSFWETMNAIGAKGGNVLPGQWGSGVAESVQKAQQGYGQEDIENQAKINTLTQAANAANTASATGIYGAGMAARKDLETRQSAAQTAAAALLGHDDSAAARLAVAKTNADARTASKEDNAILAEAKLIEHHKDMASQEAAKIAQAEMSDILFKNKNPTETYDTLYAKHYRTKLGELLRGTSALATAVPTASAAPATMGADRASQFKVIR